MQRTIVVLLGLVIPVGLYWFPVRRLFGRWGTTSTDLARPMPADGQITAPTYAATLAITVNAPPARIWPWLVQMGYQRGGLYSYDWLDRLFGFLDRPSETRIRPEFQHLAPGDVIPVGRGPGFPVTAVDAGRSLVLGGSADGMGWIWQLGLYPLDDSRTKLVSRNTARVPRSVSWWFFMRVLEPAAFLMTRRMLIGIKQRAEGPSDATGRSARRAA